MLRLLIGVGQHVTEQHQNDRRRNNLPEGAGCRQRAGSQRRVVAAAQHGRQRQQAEGDHGGADNAGTRRQQRADDANRERQPAAQTTEQSRHGVEQILGDA